MKQFQKWIAMLLSVILLCNMLPMQIFAEEIRENTAATNAAASGTSSFSAEPAYIVGELEAERTAYSKEFLMSDGLHMAVLYPYAVHYETDNGWQEIDNTLVSSGDAYTNTANSWTASFPKTLTAASPISVTRDGHTVSFTLSGELRLEWGDLQLQGGLMGNSQPIVQTSQAQIESVSLDTQAAEHPETVVSTLNSRLRYENVYAGTHLVYDLGPGQVKESIVLEQYSEALRGYCYTLNTGDLIPVLQEDGSIYLFARDSEEPLMTMPAPYLEDHGGVTSYDVEVTLTPGKDGYLLTYQLPQAWLASADRQWPVILDPVIVPEMHVKNVRDCSIFSVFAPTDANNTPTYKQGALCLGQYQYYGKMRAFLKYAELPELTSSDVLVAAELSVRLADTPPIETPIQVHKVTSLWESETLNWNDHHAIWDETVQDYQMVANNFNNSRYTFNITDIVRGWYTDQNTGLMLRTPDEVENATGKYATTNNFMSFYSSDFSAASMDYSPVVTIYFRNNNGLEGYWDYTSASAGRAGTGSVNNFTGNLTWVRSDMGFGGNRMPVSISHVYNLNDINDLPDDDNNSNNSGGNTFGMGVGWRTNFNQLIYRWNVDSNYYVWEDADGTDHYFYKGTDGKYHHENNEKITLTVNGSGAETYCIEDETGNCTYFDAQGRLSKISNNQQTKSHITVAYKTETGKQIQTVTDGVGRVYAFTYEADLLQSITYQGSDNGSYYTVSYRYDARNRLTTVIDHDGREIAYTYDDNNCLISAEDIDGYLLTYAYNTVPTDESWQPWRVQSISESDGNAQGSLLTFTYGHNQTILTDHNGLQNILQFNDYGNVVSIQDGEGHAQFAQYAINTQQEANQNTDASARKNQLRLTSKLQNTVGNLLQNTPDFSDGWQAIGGATLATGEAMLHGNSLQVTSGTGAASAPFTVAAGESVTFSAYVKNPNAAAKLALCGADLGILAESEILPASDAWIRTQVTYTNDANEAIELKACFFGSGLLDHAQVEKAQTASRYNLLKNGDFSFGLAGWTGDSGSVVTASSAAAPTLEAAAYSVTGSPDAQKCLTQTLAISGSEGDSYVLTGWAMGNSVPLRDDRRFGLSVTFLNGETEVNECYVQFNPDMDASNGWQYAACPAVAEGSYTAIRVSLCYDYNANTVCFDGIQLYKEQFGVSYTYDNNGNVISTVDLQQQETQFVYDEADPAKLLSQKLPTGEELTYTYDNWHNVIKAEHKAKAEGEAEAPVKQTYTFGYDTWGNNTSVSISTASGSITSSADYTADGNYMESSTDALGNTVTYGYDLQTGILKWTQYPGDSETQRTEYSYDAMFRIATSVMDVDGNAKTKNSLSAAYTYENDLLTSIQTPSTTYSFSYGAFALRSKVTIGNRELASYSYTDDQNRYLEKMTYGNGDCVEYTYDELGRLASQKYNDNDTVTYSYDNDGALARVHDSATGITTTYYYDLLGRQMKYVESGTNYTHSVGYTYDAENNLSGTVERINGTDYATSYTYDKDNRITSVTADGTTKEYTYDDLNRVTAMVTKRNGQTVLTEEYTYNPGAEGGTTSQVATYTVTAGESVTVYTYTYDAKGNILSVNDGTNTTSYVYDAANQLIRENNQAGGFTHTWEYDNAGNIQSRTEYAYTTGDLGAVLDTVTYGYNDEEWRDLLTSYDGSSIQYDTIGNPLNDGRWSYEWEHGRQLSSMSEAYYPEFRITAHPENYIGQAGGTAVFSVEATTAPLSYQWQYSNNGGSAWWNSTMAGSNTASISVQATEARAGNLYRCKITDQLGETLYSDPAQIDLGGTYALAVLSNPKYYSGNIGETATFAVKARGTNITYQWQYSNNGGTSWWNSSMAGSATPTMTVALTEARQNYLYRCKITDAEGNTRYSAVAGFYLPQYGWEFTYDSNGMRTGRTDGTTTYSYIYNGSKLSQMTVDGEEFTFAYDANGRPMTITWAGGTYYYSLNLQGDVVGLLDASGNQIATYTYDAWGNFTVESDDPIADYNPLTYRGYVYDAETGLYYLQSRYYDPEMGRFINADGLVATGQGPLGNNMFTYCGNNSVNYIDPSGQLPTIIEKILKYVRHEAQRFKEEAIITAHTFVLYIQLLKMGFHNVTLASARECATTLRNNGIDTAEEKAHFFSQCAAETNFGTWLTEIGDDAYFNKNGYGRKFRGAGYIQLTWDFNYEAFANAMGDDEIYAQGADYVAANYAWAAAGWFWTNNNINDKIAMGASVRDVTIIVRGGSGGWEQRQSYYEQFYAIFV